MTIVNMLGIVMLLFFLGSIQLVFRLQFLFHFSLSPRGSEIRFGSFIFLGRQATHTHTQSMNLDHMKQNRMDIEMKSCRRSVKWWMDLLVFIGNTKVECQITIMTVIMMN